ncbi:MAG: nuclear transport factor 2 family protein, partial [Cyanobacteria bacterium]|nr:nuclear transport factor 2 family protein [Cyanobacteriota bacterium]
MATQTHTEAVATAQIKNVVQSVAVYADTRRFRELKSFFSPQVNVDYTSAFGGSPETVSSDELMLR